MIVFGSRGSDLALTQSRQIAERLSALTGEQFRIKVISTKGDRILDKPLAAIGGKGLFTAELEAALRDGSIDVAVHSLKDLPVEDPEGLAIGAVPARVTPYDVLVFNPKKLDTEAGSIPLVANSRIGTSSPRRRSAIKNLRPDLDILDLRGNVPTRIQKVVDDQYDAVVLAAAGLLRLGIDDDALAEKGLAKVEIAPDRFPSAPAQGALGIQCREDDARILDILANIHDEVTAQCVQAERGLLLALGGGCSMPLGSLVAPKGDGYRIRAALYASDESGHRSFIDTSADSVDQLEAAATEILRPLVGDPLANTRVFLIRPGGEGGELASALRVAGAQLSTIAMTESLPIVPDDHQVALLRASSQVLFTSARAVDRFFEEAADLDLAKLNFYAGGPSTARAIEARGYSCTRPDNNAGGGKALAQLLVDSAQADSAKTLLFPCAEDHRPELEATLKAAGYTVHAVPLYRIAVCKGVELPEEAHDCIVFTSPSAVSAYNTNQSTRPGRHLAIGETTATAMRDANIPPHGVATSPTAHALVQLILEHKDV